MRVRALYSLKTVPARLKLDNFFSKQSASHEDYPGRATLHLQPLEQISG